MKNKVTLTPFFSARYKRLMKKFVSLASEMDTLIQELINEPNLGTPLGSGLYKVRLASQSKGGGFRVITYLVQERNDGIDIFLITMFDKSEESSIKKDQLVKLVKLLFES